MPLTLKNFIMGYIISALLIGAMFIFAFAARPDDGSDDVYS
jgi:hypothetical protein